MGSRSGLDGVLGSEGDEVRFEGTMDRWVDDHEMISMGFSNERQSQGIAVRNCESVLRLYIYHEVMASLAEDKEFIGDADFEDHGASFIHV